MRTLASPEGYRNMGGWNEATQQGLYDSNVAIGGIGGAGYLTGIELAHMGVQNFSVADPEDFEAANSNRVLGARSSTYGHNKAEVFADVIHDINPDANVRVFREGINVDNVEEFMRGAHVVLDATELSMPELGTMICREARRSDEGTGKVGVPVVNVEYVIHGAQGTSFDPNSKWTFEKVMGIKGGENAPLDEVKDQRIATDRFLSYIPRYADLGSLAAMEEGAPLPSNMTGAGLAAGIAVAEILKHIRQRNGEKGLKPVFAPQVRWMDVYTGESGVTKHPRLSFYRHLAGSFLRNKLGLYEPASYDKEARAARGDVGEL